MHWCILMGVTASLLLLAGGLGALQTATLLAALPFTFIMLLIAFGLVRQTKADLEGVSLSDEAPAIGERLKRLFVPASKASRQISTRGLAALETICEAMLADGWAESHVDSQDGAASLTITFAEDRVFIYRLGSRSRPLAAYTALEAPEGRRSLTWLLSARTERDVRDRDLTDFSSEQIVSDILTQLERWRPK
nr:BCCT family transporter [uncultured Novosphingobium sp.]